MKLPIKIKLDALKGVIGKLGAVKGMLGIFGKKKKKKKIDDEDIDEDDFIPSSSRDKDDDDIDDSPRGAKGRKDSIDDDEDEDGEEVPDFDEEMTDEELAEEAEKRKRLLMFGGVGAGVAAILGIITWLIVAPPDPADSEADSRIPKVVQSLEVLEAETMVLDQAIGRSTDSSGGGDGTEQEKSLNELAAGNAAPGRGVSFPATTTEDFANLSPAPKGNPLKEAPNYEMVEEIDVGLIPRISDTGKTAFKEYSRPNKDVTSDRPRIAIIVTGLGQSRAATEAAIKNLPPEISLAIDSHSRGIAYWIDRAREVGHEVLLTLPMESVSFPFEDPGPGTLRVLEAPEENVKQVEWIMSRASGYFGLMGVAGSKFTTNQEQTAFILKAIKDRGLMFVDGGYTLETLVPRIAFKEQVTWAAVEMEIDTELDGEKIEEKLAALETLAQRRSISIGRISPYPVSIAHLSEWIKTLQDKGIDLVPVSSLANKQLVR